MVEEDDTLPIRAGDRIAGKYRVERVLGRGGMGVVFAALHGDRGERVAIKVLTPRYKAIREVRERFMREARAAVKIKGEHAVRVLDVAALDDGTPYVVMEYLEGEDLASFLSRKGGVSASEAILYTLQICEALRSAHSVGIVHGNLKPTNVFLARPRGKPPTLKVLDFGISLAERHDRRSPPPYEVLVAPWYMAPERLKRSSARDARSDVWSVGILMYEIATGEVPFDGETMPEIIVKVLEGEPSFRRLRAERGAAGLEPIIQRCLTKAPETRYRSIDELASALRAVDADLQAAPRASRPPSTLPSRASVIPSRPPPPTMPSLPPERVGLEDVELVEDGGGSQPTDDDANDDDAALAAEVELLPSMTPPPDLVESLSADVDDDDDGDRAAATSTILPRDELLARPKATPPPLVTTTTVAPEPARPAITQPATKTRLWVSIAVAIIVVPAALFASRSLWRSTTPVSSGGGVANNASTSPPALPVVNGAMASSVALEPDERPMIVFSVDAGAAVPSKVQGVAPPTTTGASSAGLVRRVERIEAGAPAASTAAIAATAPTTTSPTTTGSAASTEDDATVGFRIARLHHETLRQTCWDTSDKTTSVVTVTATVDPSGAVRNVSASTTDAKLGQCVEGQVRTWSFPPSDSMRALRIPIRFRH